MRDCVIIANRFARPLHARRAPGVGAIIGFSIEFQQQKPRFQETCMEDAKHFINNRWVAPSGRETIPVVDPSDGQIFAQIARGSAADIDLAVAAARAAFKGD